MSVVMIPAEEYVRGLLSGASSLSMTELSQKTDFHMDNFNFVMLMQILMERTDSSPYSIEFGEGNIIIRGYSVPSMTIHRK